MMRRSSSRRLHTPVHAQPELKQQELSTANTDVLFLKVDVDAVEAVAAEAGISAMPTFQVRDAAVCVDEPHMPPSLQVWKNGSKADELVGASKERLADMLARNK